MAEKSVNLANVPHPAEVSVGHNGESAALMFSDADGNLTAAATMSSGKARQLAQRLLDVASTLEGADAPPIRMAADISAMACTSPQCGCGMLAVRLHDKDGGIFAGMEMNPAVARQFAADILAEAEKTGTAASTLDGPVAGHA